MRRRWSAWLGFAAFAAAPLAAQLPEPSLLTTERAARLTGTYASATGQLVHVMDLVDQVGQPLLSMIEYDAGRTRILYPTEEGDFTAGAAWFDAGPPVFRVRFRGGAGPADGFTREEEGDSTRFERVPLSVRDVRIRNGDVVLAGSLVSPPSGGPHPFVLMIAGSGPLTRRSPLYVGELLAASGFAVLAMDKRGTGGSTGEWQGLSPVDWASDVEAQLDYALRLPEVDPSRVGIMASSEGGFVGPIVAARRPEVRFLVCRVCAWLPNPGVIVDQETNALRNRGVAEADVEVAAQLLRRFQRYAMHRTDYDGLVAMADSGRGRPWRQIIPRETLPAPESGYWDTYRGLLEADPRDAYRSLDIPVLAILGETDDRVVLDRHMASIEALDRDGARIEPWVIPGVGHGLLTADDRGVQGYPPGFHPRLVRWFLAAAAASTDP